MAATAAGGREEEAWQLLVESAELARLFSFRELTQLARLSRGFKRLFDRALSFLWRSRGAACARAELSHVVKRAVSCGKASQVRILVPLVVARNLEKDHRDDPSFQMAEGSPEAQAGGVAPYLFDAIRLGHVAVVGRPARDRRARAADGDGRLRELPRRERAVSEGGACRGAPGSRRPAEARASRDELPVERGLRGHELPALQRVPGRSGDDEHAAEVTIDTSS